MINTNSADKVTINIKIIGIIVNHDFIFLPDNHIVPARSANAARSWFADPNRGQITCHFPDSARTDAAATVITVAIYLLLLNIEPLDSPLFVKNSWNVYLPRRVAVSSVVRAKAETASDVNITPTL